MDYVYIALLSKALHNLPLIHGSEPPCKVLAWPFGVIWGSVSCSSTLRHVHRKNWGLNYRPYYYRHTAAYLCALPSPVGQWNSVEPLPEMAHAYTSCTPALFICGRGKNMDIFFSHTSTWSFRSLCTVATVDKHIRVHNAKEPLYVSDDSQTGE